MTHIGCVYTTSIHSYDRVASGALFKWPQKISVYPIPELILSQSTECKRQLSTEMRKLNVIADTNHGSPFRTFVNMLIEKKMVSVTCSVVL